MKLLKILKEKRQSYLKDKNKIASSILTTLLGELETKAKRDNTDISDDLVISVCKKFINSNEETLKFKELSSLKEENEILKFFIPETMTISEIIDILVKNNVEDFPSAMKYLKDNFSSKYDAKECSVFLKSFYSNR